MSKYLKSHILIKRYVKAFQEVIEKKGIRLDLLKNELINLSSKFVQIIDKKKISLLKVSSNKTQLNLLERIGVTTERNTSIYNFCKILAINRRLYLFPQIINQLLTEIDIANNITTAEIVSAKELTEENIQEIMSELKKISGKDVQIKLKINPKILGGLIITMNSKIFDDSVVSKFRKLETSFI